MRKISNREKILQLKHKEKFQNYTILSKKATTKGSYATPVGEGGSGVVYLSEQEFIKNVKVKRAIKFFVFRDDFAGDGPSGKVSTLNFRDEILNISSFNHENIIKIIDGGITEKNIHTIPFIVTDYVDGHTLQDMVTKADIFKNYIRNGEDLIDIFTQICTGLSYLHRQHFYHCDIAPKNIFIKRNVESFQLIIGDLGVGKTLNVGNGKKRGKLQVIGSKKYMSGAALPLLNKEISFDEFSKLQPEWDLYSLKKSFEEMAVAYEENYRNTSPWYYSLKKILLEDFKDVSSIGERIQQVKPIYRKYHDVSELSEADSSSGGSKELQPIRSVWITNRIKSIIRHPAYSRLKKVPQLLSSNTFNPGSNHSRYEHSLGTYEHMRLTLVSLLRGEDFISRLSKSNIELALIAALLSNLPKFPFSFIIEEIRMRDRNYFLGLKQEEVLQQLVNYKDVHKGILVSIKEIIEEKFPGVSYETLVDILRGEVIHSWPTETKFINKLLHCTIDMRVVDFLQRDSYHIGISHGAHINFDSLIDNICIHNDTLAIYSKGVTDVEQVVTLRYWLYKRIYWNTLNRAYTAVLKQIFVTLYQNKPDFEKRFRKEILFADSITVLAFIESEITSLNKQNRNRYLDLHNLLETITAETPKVFKELYLINQTESSSAEFNDICREFGDFSFEKVERLRQDLENRLSTLISFERGHVNLLIDIPPKEEKKKLGEDLTVIKTDKTPVSINKISGLIHGISTTFDENLRFLRVYLNPLYESQLDQEKRQKAKEIIDKFLLDSVL